MATTRVITRFTCILLLFLSLFHIGSLEKKRVKANGKQSGITPKNTSLILRNLRRLMRNTNHVSQPLDAYLIPKEDAHQTEYYGAERDSRLGFVSGYTGSKGFAAVTLTKAAVFPFLFYYILASNDLDNNWDLEKGAPLGVQKSRALEKWLSKNLQPGARIGIDTFLVDHAWYQSLRKELHSRGFSLVSAGSENLVDLVWSASSEQRPPPSDKPITILPLSLAGKSWQPKVTDVRKKMSENKANMLILSALDELAWLFNLRGADIEYYPVFFSYAVITNNYVRLFIDDTKVSDKLKMHLNTNAASSMENGTDYTSEEEMSVEILPYNSVLSNIAALQKNATKVWLPTSTSEAVASVVDKERRLLKSLPVEEMKARKNPMELAGMRDAHLKDAVAYCRFLYWLEREVSSNVSSKSSRPTEMSAASMFEQLRRDDEDYVGPSFATISCVGVHAAQPHYYPRKETDTTITTDRVYMVDSGGQYRDRGTTDVARTLHFGEPTDRERKMFTLVLKGHIALASQKFPVGWSGGYLDTLARAPLWHRGFRYDHSTGHGVGHYLNVHEGPRVLSPFSSKKVLLDNMTVAIEPGYRNVEREYGILIENVYAVVPADVKGDGNFLMFDSLTLVPIQTKMLERSLLTHAEISWLNSYHSTILERVGPALAAGGYLEVLEWLKTQCAPIR